MSLNLSSFLQWRFNILMCRALGLRITYYYISFLGKLYFFFKKNEKWQIKKALSSVFSNQKRQFEIRSLTKNVFRGIIFHYYEKFVNAFASPEALKSFLDIHVEDEGMTALEKALAKGNGALLITGHFGGLEFIPAFLGGKNYPVTIVARFSTNSLRKLCFHQADKFSVKVIDGDHTPNIAKAIFTDLRENRIVITQCDEIDEWRPCHHKKIQFLGQWIHLDKTIDLLSNRCQAAVVFGVMHRNHQNRYKFIATSWEEMAKRFQLSKNMSIGAVVLKFMEHYIYKYPEGWYQWKKYPTLHSFAPSGTDTKAPVSIPVLEPSPT